MKKKFNIKLINDDTKHELIKNINSNYIYNRADLLNGGDFELIELKDENENTIYIPFYIRNYHLCYLCVYMMDISQEALSAIIDFIQKTFKQILKFEIWHSLNSYKGLEHTTNLVLDLPDTIEEFNSRFSSKTIYNRKYARRKLQENFNVEYKYYSKNEFTKELFEEFLRLKTNADKLLSGSFCYYSNDPMTMFGNIYGLTDVWTLSLDGKICAMILYSCLDGKYCWCENMTYDAEYKKYGIGNILYYYSIEKLIEKQVKKVSIGGGGDKYAYKTNSKPQFYDTYSGKFKKVNINNLFLNTIHSIYSKNKDFDSYKNKHYKYILILGKKYITEFCDE